MKRFILWVLIATVLVGCGPEPIIPTVAVLPSITPPATPTATPVATLPPTVTPSITPTLTLSPTQASASPAATNTLRPSTTTRYIYDETPANIRECASTDCAIVTTLAPGSAIEVLGIATNGWYEIQLDNGATAFVADFLTLTYRPQPTIQQQPFVWSTQPPFVWPTQRPPVQVPSSDWPSFCDQPCAQLTCSQAAQCGWHPDRDGDSDGRACEFTCW